MNQSSLVSFLNVELEIAFMLVRTAELGTAGATDRTEAIKKARASLARIREVSISVEVAERQRILARADELNIAILQARPG